MNGPNASNAIIETRFTIPYNGSICNELFENQLKNNGFEKKNHFVTAPY